MSTGTINVQTENIFPLIKKFLYSDQEIFLREMVSNAVDACQKLKTLSSVGEAKGEIDDLEVKILVDEKAKTLTIRDNGIGMTGKEIEKYIADIAFSGAEEFVNKYKDKAENIIGHFGLGFFSAFMVAEKVEIISKSYKKSKGAKWVCEGNPDYHLEDNDKKDRGTDIVLHISKDSKEFLQESKIKELLNKYCKFLPIPIKFGDEKINNIEPAWTKKPAKLKDDDYKNFYRELYPFTFEDPLFNIHLNVDYPFSLTGILYFPKLKGKMDLQKNKIQLYSNQVFVTDSVEGIVPEFLTLLHGVLDSPDIPLNVSRSYLQSDSNVKKISSHIAKKVADRLEDIFKKDREDFEKKWEDIQVFIEYGILTDDKFYDRASKFMLLKNSEGKYFTLEEYEKKIKTAQTDKDGKLIYLYASDAERQHAFIEAAKARSYDVLLMNTSLTSHFLGKLEEKLENVSFVRVDADSIDKLIKKEEEAPSKLSEEQQNQLKPVIEGIVAKEKFTVVFENMSEKDQPISITQPEFMRRMKEMSEVGGGGMYGNMPETYNLIVNSNHPLIGKILVEADSKKQNELVKQATDLALLSQGLLKGEELTKFIKRSVELID